MRPCFRLLLLMSWIPLISCGQDASPEGEKKEAKPPGPIATLDIRNSKEGSIPGGSNVVKGKWKVSEEAEELRVLAEPLVASRLEFGPEVREKGATILATGRAPGAGRLQSRFGAGIYGKNGFHLRLVPLADEIELVRRGVVLRAVGMSIEPDRDYTIELTIESDEDQWVIRGSAWDSEKGAVESTTIEYRIYNEELLFPLAGRAVLTGTPFSGEPVAFKTAQLFPEGYVRKEPESEVDPEDSEDDSETEESD